MRYNTGARGRGPGGPGGPGSAGGEAVAIRFSCICGKKLKVGDDATGKQITCPGCGATTTVPSPDELEQMEIAPLESFDDEPPPEADAGTSSGPVDLAEARRESRRSRRDRRREMEIKPGKGRPSAEARKEARQGIRDASKRKRESRKSVARPGRVRPSSDARKEAREGLRDQAKRRRDSRRSVARPGSARPTSDASREAREGLREIDARRRESARQLRGERPAPVGPVSAPVPGRPFVTPPFCPSCRAATVPGSLICTVCGLNFQTGAHFRMKRSIFERIPPKTIVGPILAIAVLWAAYEYGLKRLLADPPGQKPSETAPASSAKRPPAPKKKTPPKTQPGKPGKPGKPAQPAPPPPPDYSAAGFKGGIIKESVTFDDTTAPYVFEKSMIVDKGGALKIGPGVRIKGKNMDLGNAKLHIAGAADRPVFIEVNVNSRRDRNAEVVAEHCYFLKTLTVGKARRVRLKNCTFEKTLRLEPTKMGASGNMFYTVSECELKNTGEAASLAAYYTTERLQMELENCNIYGPVTYWVENFARLELRGCHFVGRERLVAERGEGTFVNANKSETKLIDVGAGTKAAAAGGSTSGGSIWASETTAADADRLVEISNPRHGFTVKIPGDWKTANAGELITGPLKLARPSVTITFIEKGVHPSAAVTGMVRELKKKGAQALKDSPHAKSVHPAGESLRTMVSYDAGGFRWRKKFVTVTSGGKLFVIVGTYREDKAIEVGSAMDSVILSFKLE